MKSVMRKIEHGRGLGTAGSRRRIFTGVTFKTPRTLEQKLHIETYSPGAPGWLSQLRV